MTWRRGLAWHNWPLAVKLIVLLTSLLVLTVVSVTLLSLRREQASFRTELEQQAMVLLDTLALAHADQLYYLDAGALSRTLTRLAADKVLEDGCFFDGQGRIIADTHDPHVALRLRNDPFAQRVLAQPAPVLEWQAGRLRAGRQIIVGEERLGGVCVTLSTVPLQAKLAVVQAQGVQVALAALTGGLLLALLISRSITVPIHRLTSAADRVAQGDLTPSIAFRRGDELGRLAQAFASMTARLSQLIERLEERAAAEARSAAEAEEARRAAEVASEAKSRFVAMMSHEIRTPLNAVLGSVDLLSRTLLTIEQQEYVETIRAGGDSLLAVVGDILDFSKIEADRLELEYQPFDLRLCVRQALDVIAPEADRNKLKLRSLVVEDVPNWVVGDAARLRQVLLNVLSNAVKFTPHGSITLSVTCGVVQPIAAGSRLVPQSHATNGTLPCDLITFAIADTGIGISLEQQRSIFQPFQQGDSTTTRRYGGTGLGLAISKQLVDLMGGTLLVDSRPGSGSTFFVTVPLPKTAQPAAAPADSSAQLAQQPQLRILLAEDNPVNLRVLVRMLERLGQQPDIAINGQEVLVAIGERDYDVILMDVQMPELDGVGATQAIRSDLPRERQPWIIALTANAVQGDYERYLAAGMDDYLSKPVGLDGLANALARSGK